MSRAWIEVDLDAIARNAQLLRVAAGPAGLCAVVKANGYGHGAIQVATTVLAAGASHLAVAQVDEGIALVDAGIEASILVLSEPGLDEWAAVRSHGLQPAVYSHRALDALEATVGSEPVVVHLKIDTGMARVGAAPADALGLGLRIASSSSMILGSVWTHLACADELGHQANAAQLERFTEVRRHFASAGIEVPRWHAANTAATLSLPSARGDLVRCGIGLYGYDPRLSIDEVSGADGVSGAEREAGVAGLRPAMRVVSRVSMVKRVPPGTPVSYGHRRATSGHSTLATVPIGYADGVPRRWFEQGYALIGGQRHRFAGMITMDQLVIDCGDRAVQIGDEVVLLGRQGDEELTADDWADALGTISYEVLCGFGARLPRVAIKGSR